MESESDRSEHAPNLDASVVENAAEAHSPRTPEPTDLSSMSFGQESSVGDVWATPMVIMDKTYTFQEVMSTPSLLQNEELNEDPTESESPANGIVKGDANSKQDSQDRPEHPVHQKSPTGEAVTHQNGNSKSVESASMSRESVTSVNTLTSFTVASDNGSFPADTMGPVLNGSGNPASSKYQEVSAPSSLTTFSVDRPLPQIVIQGATPTGKSPATSPGNYVPLTSNGVDSEDISTGAKIVASDEKIEIKINRNSGSVDTSLEGLQSACQTQISSSVSNSEVVVNEATHRVPDILHGAARELEDEDVSNKTFVVFKDVTIVEHSAKTDDLNTGAAPFMVVPHLLNMPKATSDLATQTDNPQNMNETAGPRSAETSRTQHDWNVLDCDELVGDILVRPCPSMRAHRRTIAKCCAVTLLVVCIVFVGFMIMLHRQ